MTSSDTHFTASGSSSGGSPPPKPVTIPYTFAKIPSSFRERPQWVCWKYVLRDKWTKPPFQAKQIGALAKSTDRTTWATFDEAVAAYPDPASKYDGIGYLYLRTTATSSSNVGACTSHRADAPM